MFLLNFVQCQSVLTLYQKNKTKKNKISGDCGQFDQFCMHELYCMHACMYVLVHICVDMYVCIFILLQFSI